MSVLIDKQVFGPHAINLASALGRDLTPEDSVIELLDEWLAPLRGSELSRRIKADAIYTFKFSKSERERISNTYVHECLTEDVS